MPPKVTKPVVEPPVVEPPVSVPPAAEPIEPPVTTTEQMVPYSRFKEVNDQKVAAERRAEALDKAAQEAEANRLKEQGDYKKLYETQEADLARAKAGAAKADSLETTLKTVLDAQVAEIPEARRSLIPEELTTQQKLDWIAKNRAVLLAPVPPDLGAGRFGGGRPPEKHPELTPEEKEVARKFGMSEEDYAKHK